jgi:hypothetical protein
MFGIEGNFLAAFALFAYIPFAFILFVFLPPRKAVIYDFLVAWLFLPMSHLPLHGFTDLNKMSAACVGTLAAALVFDSPTVFSFRPKIWDIPMLVWCVCPFVSSIGNGFDSYDAFSAVAYQVTSWGLPYFIGRIYFTDLKGLRELAIGIVAGGLVYVPLCWFEIRMSPQLNVWVYGYHQHDFSQTVRYGGYRPMVFMQHGLAVAMWMVTASLTAFWLWRCKAADKVLGISIGWATVILIGTSLCLRSVGAELLMILGLATLVLTGSTKSRTWILLLTLVPPLWITVRVANLWDGKNLVAFMKEYDARSADSLEVRFHSEHVLSARALEHPIYGWSPWYFLTKKVNIQLQGIPDQLWIIAFGQFGLIGLISLTTSLLMPIWLVARRIPVRYWTHAGAAAPAAMAMLLTLHMCDNLFNAMVNPIYMICAGGLTALSFSFRSPAEFAPRPAPKKPEAPVLPFRSGAAPA